jgi:murein DD-endopeptidase MepM/ murein hydrolase activator NlpD
MRVQRLAALLPFALAACATAPSAPPPDGAFPRAMGLCSGDVSNAPEADGRGRIEEFTPFVELRGVILARAPVAGCLSSGFGPREGGAGKFHAGIDIATVTPKPVRAAADGVVARADYQGAWGNKILIEHRRGVETRYAHLSEYAPRIVRGVRVSAGEVIGYTGKTGNATGVHLHYEILVDGRALNPLTLD